MFKNFQGSVRAGWVVGQVRVEGQQDEVGWWEWGYCRGAQRALREGR